MRQRQKKVAESELKTGYQFENGEVVTRVSWPLVITTAQRQQGYATADTFAYYASEKGSCVTLRKHSRIKGTKGYRAIGG